MMPLTSGTDWKSNASATANTCGAGARTTISCRSRTSGSGMNRSSGPLMGPAPPSRLLLCQLLEQPVVVDRGRVVGRARERCRPFGATGRVADLDPRVRSVVLGAAVAHGGDRGARDLHRDRVPAGEAERRVVQDQLPGVVLVLHRLLGRRVEVLVPDLCQLDRRRRPGDRLL